MANLTPLADFPASVSRVSTLADGSPRIQLDCPEDVNRYLSLLADCQAQHRYLHVVVYDAVEFDEVMRDD